MLTKKLVWNQYVTTWLASLPETKWIYFKVNSLEYLCQRFYY